MGYYPILVEMAERPCVVVGGGIVAERKVEALLGVDDAEFRRRFCDTKIFYDNYAGSKFADFIFKAGAARKENGDSGRDLARQRVEEAQLFIDAAHRCYGLLQGARATP